MGVITDDSPNRGVTRQQAAQMATRWVAQWIEGRWVLVPMGRGRDAAVAERQGKEKQADQRRPLSYNRGVAEALATEADPSKIPPVQQGVLEAFSPCGSISRAVKVGGS